MTMIKLQEFCEKLPDGLELGWLQYKVSSHLVKDDEDMFLYKGEVYDAMDLLKLETLLPLFHNDKDGHLFQDIWVYLDELSEILEELDNEELEDLFGTGVRVLCTNQGLEIHKHRGDLDESV